MVVNSKNKLLAVGLNIYCDTGHVFNSPTSLMAAMFAQNVYAAKHWKIVPYAVATSTAANTYVRSPGTSQVIKST